MILNILLISIIIWTPYYTYRNMSYFNIKKIEKLKWAKTKEIWIKRDGVRDTSNPKLCPDWLIPTSHSLSLSHL